MRDHPPVQSAVRPRPLAAVLSALALVGAALATSAPSPAAAPPAVVPDLGPNVTIIDPSMPTAEIQAVLDDLAADQVDDEMGSNRHSVLFLPGDYGSAQDPLQARVGYYTEIAGLGEQPTDVTVDGKIEVYNRCLGDGGTSNCLALNN